MKKFILLALLGTLFVSCGEKKEEAPATEPAQVEQTATTEAAPAEQPATEVAPAEADKAATEAAPAEQPAEKTESK